MNEADNKKKKKKTGLMTYILGGKIFNSEIFLNNRWLIGLVVIYSFIYVSNRYAFQQEVREIKRLEKERTDLKYDLLNIQSLFSDKSRQSNIEKYIKNINSELKPASQPPFTIK